LEKKLLLDDLSVGVDCIEIDRFSSENLSNKHFLEKIFTSKEIKYCLSQSLSHQHFAVRFAAKEAVKKCLKEKSIGLSFSSIEIVHENQVPEVIIHKSRDFPDIKISLSHSDNIAMAVAIAYKN
tara:strand:- start:1055 stop:1426 length:372 start_codon:yes stop_codon:yes gene_type:complete